VGSRKILIAAGGTGGHIYPALAMADAFKERKPEITVEFVGTLHGLENKIVPAHGYRVHHLPIGRLNSNVPLSERLKTVLLLPWALMKSALLLMSERPDFVLGVGGHASGPLLLMASLLGYRNAIWEPNAMPGMANRILSRFVDDCWVVFDEAKSHLHGRRIHVAGMPVRAEIESLGASAVSTRKPFRILVFGGSQGARGLNTTTMEMVRAGGEWLQDVHIVHQTGPTDFERLESGYGDLLGHGRVEIRDYIHDMAAQYAAADLVICRSGTGTLSELAACGKAAILIPFPFAADDHQRKNAESLVEKGAAVMILQKDLTVGRLRSAIQELRADPVRCAEIQKRIRAFHRPQAAAHLVGEFLERMDGHASGES
jgi:UDP-N-acetylglucosamine--N-acetylmuramyl-(pentapeptide) pyrophosphoryl-undecaprenol N-acetylglucosamine transferase